MKLTRFFGVFATVVPWLVAVGLGLGGCAGQSEVVKAPAAAKVDWGKSGDSPASDAAETDAEAEEEPAPSSKPAAPAAAEPVDEAASAVEDGAIDLDAKPAASAPEAEPEAEEAPAADEPTSDSAPVRELQKRRIAREKSVAKGKKAAKAAKKSAPAEPAAAAATYKGSDPCRAESFSVQRVKAACASGGRPAAKKVMKDAIGNATANGQMLKCSTCHSNQRDYALKSDAVADLKRWLDG